MQDMAVLAIELPCALTMGVFETKLAQDIPRGRPIDRNVP